MDNIEIDNESELSRENIEEKLLSYCRTGNFKQVVHLFDKYYECPGFNINCRDHDGNTPIIFASRQGHGSIVELILRYMPDITLENKRGQTVLHFSTKAIQKMVFGSISSLSKCTDRIFCNACWLGNVEVVDRKLNKEHVKVSENLLNLDGVNCYHLTLRHVTLLEQISKQIGVCYKPAQVLQSLLSRSSNIPRAELLLHSVASKISKHSIEIARVLINKGFEINDKDQFDFTPIHLAARSGNVEVLEFLLSRIAHKTNRSTFVDCQGKAGNTPLHLAATEGREEAVRILLNHGASKDIVNSDNYSALQLSKSVRIKNILFQNSHASNDGSVIENRICPEMSFLHNRANTALPLSKPKLSNGKKSAEPSVTNRKKSEPSFCISGESMYISNDFSHSDSLFRSQESLNDPVNRHASLCEIVDQDESYITEPTDPKIETTSNLKDEKMPKTKPSIVNKPIRNTFRNNPKLQQITNKNNKINKTIKKSVKSPIPATQPSSQSEVAYESDFSSESSSVTDDMNEAVVQPEKTDCPIKWKKGEQIGKGSFGIVWKGMLENGQYIAVKEILITEIDDLNGDSLNHSRIEIRREIDILRNIRHKNIVKYLGATDSQFHIEILMEFVSGGSIFYILSKFGGLSVAVVQIYLKQIVAAVSFLHNRSIVHRDLKAANIMVTPKGVVKLIDFGCAKRLEGIGSSTNASLTQQQQSRLRGSVYWLAPEVINGNRHTNKSDVWSIGCTVIEMITTKPPWSDLHLFAALYAIGSGKTSPVNLRNYCSSSGERPSSLVCQFVDACLTRNAASRPSASDLAASEFLK